MFENPIEAWANGPVSPDLYAAHRGAYTVTSVGGDPSTLTATQCETIDVVLAYYGDKSSQWLSDLTHAEDPWKNARRGLAPGQRGSVEISHSAMAEYYSRLSNDLP